jgi:AcrR family transcriptional regulator
VPSERHRASRTHPRPSRPLEAALKLGEERRSASISLREVTRAASIVPTAFYRHFDSMDELGMALVDECTRTLRQMIRDARRDSADDPIAGSVAILVRNVREHGPDFRFLARERFGGVPAIRRAISNTLRLFTHELTVYLARMPGLQTWSNEDLEMAADLMVGTMLKTIQALLEVDPRYPDDEAHVIRRAEH